MKKTFTNALALTAAISAAAVLAGCSSGPQSTVESFYKDIIAGNYKEAVNFIDLTGNRTDMSGHPISAEQFHQKVVAIFQMQGQMLKQKGAASVEVTCQSKNDFSDCTVKIKDQAGVVVDTETNKLKKVDGKWLIK